ncbi:MAG: cell division ATP-binding protein FtsE [Candidatus Staskawiczbacteria bacterium]|nr:cell division ATP-binding protein FtsE [Candidatus Staskawiczbacteria bacterium]
MIRFKKVTKTYSPSTTVLEDVSFEIEKGEFVSIVGKSGAGKTTLIKLLLGFEAPTSGEIYFQNININETSAKDLQEMRRKIGSIFQDYKLFNGKTVYENVAYILEVEGKEDEEINREVPKVLEIIGLSEKMNNFPNELSGGEQQRLAIARALINRPEIIIADEPTGNLDPYNTYEVVSLLEKINKAGKTVILSTHDREIINKLGKRVITIENGKIVRDEKRGRFII